MGAMAASGGYYISAPADKILADRNCWTGSIGVTMGTQYDISGLLSKYGIKAENLTAGKNKAMGSYVEPLTTEQRQIIQSLLDESYNQFVGVVAEGRKMSVKDVKTLADGRIYTAKQALQNGLIDGIATEDETTQLLKKDYNLNDCDLVYIESSSKPSWLTNFLATQVGPILDKLNLLGVSDLQTALNLAKENNNMPIEYLYRP